MRVGQARGRSGGSQVMQGLVRSWWGQAGGVVALWVLVVLIGLGERGLWNPAEPRYAGVVSELLREGEWLVPTYNGALYDQKPPLVFWAAAGCLWAGGNPTSLAMARMPSALGALGLLLGVWLLGRRLWGRSAGVLAAMVLAGSWAVFWSGRFLHLDMPLAAAMVWSMLALVAASESSGRQRWAWIALATLSIAAGALIKGPMAIVFPGVVLGLQAVVMRDAATLRKSGVGWATLGGLVLALAWFLPAWREAGNEWAYELLVRQGLGRLMDPAHLQKHTALYYPGIFWGLAGAWSPLLPFALVSAWRRGVTREDRRAVVLATVWFGVVLVVAMLGETRRSRYLIPALPAFALLVGRMLSLETFGSEHWLPARRALEAITVMIGVVLVITGATLQVPELIPDVAATGRIVSSVMLVTAGVLIVTALLRHRTCMAFVLAVGGLAVTATLWGVVGAPTVEKVRGDAEYVTQVRKLVDSGLRPVVLGSYGERESTFGFLGFNLGRFVDHLAEPEVLERGELMEDPMVLLVSDRCLPRFLPLIGEDFAPIAPRPFGHAEIWIYVNPWQLGR